jgi:hypothetical protein
MPKKAKKVAVIQDGAGFLDVMKSINGFLKKPKIFSTVGNALGSAGVPYVGQAGAIASSLGYGKKKRVGSGVRVAGAGVRVAGAGKKKRVKKKK